MRARILVFWLLFWDFRFSVQTGVGMNFDEQLRHELGQIRSRGLYRELRRLDSPQGTRVAWQGRSLLNFSSNDYLGLANHPAIKAAAIRAVEEFGAGAGASRLISGSLAPHHELEEALAVFKGVESALAFSSGYAAAVGTLTALLQPGDVVILDKLVHACLVDAARLCGARLRVFAHNNMADLEKKLAWAAAQKPAKTDRPLRVLVVVESVYSMDGDWAPLRELVEIKQKHAAWLLVDEAHATGLLGPNRRGLVEELGVSDRVEIQMGTLGKALGAAGGFICGSKALTDLLVNRARSFIFSTAPTPATAAAARAALELVAGPEGAARCRKLMENVRQLKDGLRESGWTPPDDRSPIVPVILKDEQRAVRAAEQLRAAAFYASAIRYPTVARGAARLRLTVSAEHKADEVRALLEALKSIGHQT